MARDKVKEIRELILERYDKNFDGRLEINEVCECSFFFSRISIQISTVEPLREIEKSSSYRG